MKATYKHPRQIKNNFFDLIKLDFQYLKSNQDFFYYTLSFISLLLFTILVGLLWGDNLLLLVLGLGLSCLGFLEVINIKYPRTLKFYLSNKDSLYLMLMPDKKNLLAIVFCAVGIILFYFFIFSFAEALAETIINHYLIVAVFLVLGAGITLLFLIFYGPKVWSNSKLKFKTANFNRANKKVWLFFRLYPAAKKDFFVCFLGGTDRVQPNAIPYLSLRCLFFATK